MFMYAPQAEERPDEGDDEVVAARRRREPRRVVAWRYRQARLLGAGPHDARRFAESSADVGQLRRLARQGCPPRLAVRIVV